MAAAGPIARHRVFERVSVPTSFNSAADNLPASCMFVVVPRRPMLQAQGLYTEGERSSSVEPLCRCASPARMFAYWTTLIDKVK